MNRIIDALFYLSNKILRPYPLCHSRPDRSLSYHGRYFGLCARCTGMYLSGLFTILTALIWIPNLNPAVAMLCGAIFLTPGGIDGVTQLIGGRESTNLLRILTGLLMGIGIVLFVNGLFLLSFETLF